MLIAKSIDKILDLDEKSESTNSYNKDIVEICINNIFKSLIKIVRSSIKFLISKKGS